MSTPRTHRTFVASVSLAFVALWGVSARSFADVGQANNLYKDITPALRSDEVILPALAAMAPPPKQVATHESSALLLSGMQGFDEAATWAQGDTQKAVLEALKTVTKEKDFRKSFAFGQPYGADLVDPKLVRAGLYTELGDPALLPGARFLYLAALDNLVCLVNVEANRLLAEKKGDEALDLLVNMLYFSRQICDRQFYVEARWGLTTYSELCERIRDAAYIDQREARSLTAGGLKAVLGRLDSQKIASAYVDIDRMVFPKGDLLGFNQVADRLFNADGSPNDAQFASTLARLRSSNRPLRLFSEAGRWAASSAGHASKQETVTGGQRAYNDWRTRWDLGWFDRVQRNTLDYNALDSARFAAVKAVLPNMHELFFLRQVARTELVGLRNSIALVGARTLRGMTPPLLVSVRPAWLATREELGVDPFDSKILERGAFPTLKYLIPPSIGTEVTVVLPSEVTFRVLLKDDVFVLYSVGSDYSDQKAARIQNTARKIQVPADYLLYPPVQSLYRQSLVDLGQLK